MACSLEVENDDNDDDDDDDDGCGGDKTEHDSNYCNGINVFRWQVITQNVHVTKVSLFDCALVARMIFLLCWLPWFVNVHSRLNIEANWE